jgi:hypothetical protein
MESSGVTHEGNVKEMVFGDFVRSSIDDFAYA